MLGILLTLLKIVFGIITILYILVHLLAHYQRKNITNIKTKKTIKGTTLLNFFYNISFSGLSFFENVIREPKIYGDTYCASFGPVMFVNTVNPDDARKILRDSKTFEKYVDLKTQNRWSKRFAGIDNVAIVKGEQWKKQRHSIDPGFYNLDTFADTFVEKSKKLVKKMSSDNDGNIKDLKKYTQALTLDILGETIFGHDFNSIEGKHKKDILAYDYIIKKSFNPLILVFSFITNMTFLPFVKKMDKALDVMNDLAKRLADESKKKFENDKNYKPKSMLDHMVKATFIDEGDESKKMSWEELRSNIMVFFLAGHDTTSSALGFAITLLAIHPDIQEKLRKEIMEGHKDGEKTIKEPTIESVRHLKYLNCFIKENLRLFPPAVAVNSRRTTKKTTVGGFKIPKGTMVGVNIAAMQRSTKIFGDNAEEFIPERWLGDKGKKLKEAWVPFSSGPRVCVGNNFSLLEQKIFLSVLLLNYKVVSTNPKSTLQFAKSLITFPKEIPMKLVKL